MLSEVFGTLILRKIVPITFFFIEPRPRLFVAFAIDRAVELLVYASNYFKPLDRT